MACPKDLCWGLYCMYCTRPRLATLGTLSKDVFERRTSTGSEAFSLFICLDANKLVLLSFFSLLKTIYPRVSTKPLPNDAKSPLPVDVRRSKTLLLKLPIVISHGLLCHFYADDTQPYCSFKRHDQAASGQTIESCLNDIDAWLLASMFKLNRDKTELLVIGPKHKVNPPIKGIHVAGEYIEVSNNARNIGVIFDSHVNLEKHITNTCKTAFYHLQNIAKIRNCLSQDNTETLVHAFISSELDFCNALLYGLPQWVIDKL